MKKCREERRILSEGQIKLEQDSISTDDNSKLNGKKIELETAIKSLDNVAAKKKIYNVIWIMAIVVSLVELLYLNIFKNENIVIVLLIFGVLGWLYISGSTGTNSKKLLESKQELSIIEDKIFTKEIVDLSAEERAVKQLSKSQLDLDKYYQLNYNHVSKIFTLGRMIIFFGTMIIISTIALSIFKSDSTDTVVIIAGFAGGVLIDFTGAIFVMMYTKIMKTANINQYGMLETTQAYLGNVLASQIQDDKLREETLSELAKKLISKEKPINYVE